MLRSTICLLILAGGTTVGGQFQPPENANPRQTEVAPELDVPPADFVGDPPNAIAEVLQQDPNEYCGSVAKGLDHLSSEVAEALKTDDVLLVWVMNDAPRFVERREAVARGLKRVARESAKITEKSSRRWRNAVASFGEEWEMVTDGGVEETKQAAKAIRAIKSKRFTPGNVFKVVREVAKQVQPYRRGASKWTVMIVVMGSETNADPIEGERTIEYLRRRGIRAYAMGDEAPFPSSRSVRTTAGDGEQPRTSDAIGSPTLLPEMPAIPSWSTETEAPVPSGFGDYPLVRLCHETGGLYWIVSEIEYEGIDRNRLSEYVPDYSSPLIYSKSVAGHPESVALLRLAARFDSSFRTDPVRKQVLAAILDESAAEFARLPIEPVTIPTPTLRFEGPGRDVLRRELSVAQRQVAIAQFAVERAASEFEAVESRRRGARWRANHDLALGRLLALRARLDAYSRALAHMKQEPRAFQKPGSTHWVLTASKSVNGGPQVRKLAERAKSVLSGVAKDHEGTPWAIVANRELERPLGWTWREYEGRH